MLRRWEIDFQSSSVSLLSVSRILELDELAKNSEDSFARQVFGNANIFMARAMHYDLEHRLFITSHK
jgi:hypothetical protein